jgi:hypothetical protein
MLNTEPSDTQTHLEVQRHLGRCILRLQQYERLMKTVLAHCELAGPIDTLEANQREQVKEQSGKTLGRLVEDLFKTCVAPDGVERELLPEASNSTDRASLAFSHQVTMAPDRFAEVSKAVKELVKLRNNLVHHLIEQFDLSTADGCAKAISHLTATDDRIDQHHGELEAWAKGMEEARHVMVQFMQSNAFEELLVNGIAPDGSFAWPATGIVSVLRESTQQLAVDGWTSLESAKSWIQANHPEQTPEKYGCRRWRQVLHESRLFDLRYQVDGEGEKLAWFKERSS